jgi:hypothetical protein
MGIDAAEVKLCQDERLKVAAAVHELAGGINYNGQVRQLFTYLRFNLKTLHGSPREVACLICPIISL